MSTELEDLMARGRAAGVTQRAVARIGRDGRTLRFAEDGKEVRSFATCSYLGLERDPRLVSAAIEAIEEHGVAFSASRCFATSPLYAEADALLARLFDRPVVLAGSTTLAHGAALPILLDPADIVFYDQQVHHSVQTALASLAGHVRRLHVVKHNDLGALETAIQRALAGGAKRLWYCADGIYSMFGDRLPVAGLATLMQRYEALHAYLDDAHGMSWCGARGGGSLVDAPLPRERTVLATSLSKGFGCAGGVLAVPDRLTKERIENLGPSLMFSIQVPPPVLGAICASARIHLSPEIDGLQAAVGRRIRRLHELLAAHPVLAGRIPPRDGAPTPVGYVVIGDGDDVVRAAASLIDQGFLVNPVAYPAVPRDKGGLRVTVTRAHELGDLEELVHALGLEAQAVAMRKRAAI